MREKLKGKEYEAKQFLRKFPKEKAVVSFSGGKDSLVALHLAQRVGIKKAVFSDTTIESQDTIDYIKEVSITLGVKIDIAKPKKSFWELLPIFGPPSINHRWCCPTIKYPQLNEYAKKQGVLYYITGLRRNESIIRMNYAKVSKNPMMPHVIQINPIIDWTSEEVWEYIKKHELPIPPSYKKGLSRNGCVVCPYKSPKELNMLKKIEPEIWSKFEEFLIMYANMLGIHNKKEFLEGGWRSWRPPTKRKVVENVGVTDNYRIMFNNGLSEKNFNLLGILKTGNQLPLHDFQKKVKILFEKELNCVGCGACLSLCPNDALYLDNDKINVDLSKCTHCYECLNTSKLRGACIGRTYSLETSIVNIDKK